MVQKILGKSDISKETKGKKKKETRRVAIEAPTYRRTIEQRKGRSFKKKTFKTKNKQNKTKVIPEKYVMASSANQTLGGYTSSRHLWLVNKEGERTSMSPLALGYYTVKHITTILIRYDALPILKLVARVVF